MNGAYQIINFDDIEFTTGTAELVIGAYQKITDTAKRFVITHLNLDDEVYKDIQLTFENVEGTFVGTGVVNGKLAVVSIASTDQVTVSLNDITGGITSLQNALAVTDAKFNYSTTEHVVGTWVDGRPIYRKVFSFVQPTDSDNAITLQIGGVEHTVYEKTIPNTSFNEIPIDNFVRIDGIVYNKNDSGISVPSIVIYQDTQILNWYYSKTRGIVTRNIGYLGWDSYYILEYTKTTDTPPTP